MCLALNQTKLFLFLYPTFRRLCWTRCPSEQRLVLTEIWLLITGWTVWYPTFEGIIHQIIGWVNLSEVFLFCFDKKQYVIWILTSYSDYADLFIVAVGFWKCLFMHVLTSVYSCVAYIQELWPGSGYTLNNTAQLTVQKNISHSFLFLCFTTFNDLT